MTPFKLILPFLLCLLCLPQSMCASAEGDDLRDADAQLNTVFQDTLKVMPTDSAKAKLKEAERAWIAFRDAEIALNGELPGATGNTLKMLQTDLTNARSKQLIALAEAIRTGGIE